MAGDRRRYRWLLRLLPPSFREEVERDLVGTWQAEERDAARHGRRGFWLGAAADTLRVGAREYVAACWRNLGVAARQLARTPAFFGAAVLTLALGIGATTGVFTLVDAVLLRPLPWRAPETVGLVWAVAPGGERTWLSVPELEDIPRLAPGVAAIAGVMDVRLALSGSGSSVEVQGLAVSHGALRLLGVAPALGRDFSADDDRPGAAPVAMLGHDVWRTRFGGDPSIVGRTITLDERGYRVVGVLPAPFSVLPPSSVLPDRIDVWLPLQPAVVSRQRSVRFLHALVRLRPGATFAQADAELRAAGGAWTRTFVDDYRGGPWTFTLVSFERDVLRQARSALWLLSGLVGLVLALACVNVAHLFIARHEMRRADVAVRTALGASAAQLAGEHLAESGLVAVAAGTLALGLAAATPAFLRTLDPGALPRLGDAGVDGRALLFAAALTAATALSAAASGVVARRWLGAASLIGHVISTDRSGGRTRQGAALGRALIVVQTGGATAILVVALFLADALSGLQRVDLGLRAEALATARVSVSSRYAMGPPSIAFFERVVDTLAARPGVAGAAAISQLPLSGAMLGSTFVDAARGASTQPDRRIDVDLRAITPSYLAIAGTPLLAGRLFTAADGHDAPRVAIVDVTLARRLSPDGRIVGRRVRWIRQPDVDVEIVGVVAAVRHRSPADPPQPTVYRPLAQYPRTSMFLVARPRPGGTIALADLRSAVEAVDRSQAVADLLPMPARVSRSLARSRATTAIAAALAALAMALGTIGIYGVLSVGVARRRREFGVRLAIGARPAAIRALVLGEGLALAGAGMVLGSAVALWAVQVTRAALPVDAGHASLAFAGAVTLVLAGAVAALWRPAGRAAAIEPRTALHGD
jgi:putative ABC transport system permease protein